MKRRFPSSLVFSTAILAVALAKAQAGVDFVHQVVPVLKTHCGECHSGEEAKGGFSMNTRDLFLDDESAVPGDAAKSYFLQLIHDTDPDYQMPPEDKARPSAVEVAVLEQWVNEGMVWEPGFTFGEPTYEPPFEPRDVTLPISFKGRDHPIDRIIDRYLVTNRLKGPKPISDATFMRRVSLDLVGLLPTSERVRAFLNDTSPNKREAYIDELLGDDLAYTEHWLTFWNDLLRNDYAGTGYIDGGRTQITGWLYQSLIENKPFSEMLTELVAPESEASSGFINGIVWRGAVSAGQTRPIQFSQNISQAFLGINMKCASCHDSFLDKWTLNDAYSLAAIFSEEPIELHRCDKPTGEQAKAAWLFPEIGNIDPKAPKQERLQQLAGLMTHPKNGRVTRTMVNRLWGRIMGHGIVHPLDAMQTEPWNADLLDWLANDFYQNGGNLKHTLRRIVTSQAYQSATAVHSNTDEGTTYTYDGPRPKRLTAEQFVDAVWQVTGTVPSRYDAGVSRGVVTPETLSQADFTSEWFWGNSVANSEKPKKEKLAFRKDFRLPDGKTVRSAGAIGAVDGRYTAYLNRNEILSAKGAKKLSSSPGILFKGSRNNQLIIVAENRTPKSHDPGFFFALRIEFTDGTDMIVKSDASWTVIDQVPTGRPTQRWKIETLPRNPVTAVSRAAWSEAVDPVISKTLAGASVGTDRAVRSSILKSNDLMRALGRPSREQVVTSRPSELTTLEAINLSTSHSFVKMLNRGAQRLIEEVPHDEIVSEIYLATLSRLPTGSETALATDLLGNQAEPEQVTDLLWAVFMTPEFLIVR